MANTFDVYNVRTIIEYMFMIIYIWLKRFAGPGFDMTDVVLRAAVNDLQQFEVETLVGWQLDDDRDVEILVRCRGFEPQVDTCEPLEALHNDVPTLVRNFLRSHQDEDPILAEAFEALQ